MRRSSTSSARLPIPVAAVSSGRAESAPADTPTSLPSVLKPVPNGTSSSTVGVAAAAVSTLPVTGLPLGSAPAPNHGMGRTGIAKVLWTMFATISSFFRKDSLGKSEGEEPRPKASMGEPLVVPLTYCIVIVSFANASGSAWRVQNTFKNVSWVSGLSYSQANTPGMPIKLWRSWANSCVHT